MQIVQRALNQVPTRQITPSGYTRTKRDLPQHTKYEACTAGDRSSIVDKGERFPPTRFCHVRWRPVKLYSARKRSSDRSPSRLVPVRRGIQTSDRTTQHTI